jgi:hypothetical protein
MRALLRSRQTDTITVMTDLRDESEGARLRRLLSRFIGAGYAAYLFTAVVETSRRTASVQQWWTPTAVAVAVVPGLVLLAASFLSGAVAERWIRAAAVCAVAGYAVAAVGWLPAWTGDFVADSSSSTWLVRFSGLVGLCAALVFKPVPVVGVQALATALSSIVNQTGLVSAQPLWSRVAVETVWAWGFSGVFVAAAVMAVRTSHVLDDTKESVARTAAATAAQTARDRERAKVDALVHDRVIAVLLDAARTTTPHRLPDQARAALSALDELTAVHVSGVTADGGVTAVDLCTGLRSVITEVDCGVVVSTRTVADLDCLFPIEAVSAVLGATAEAVRNSVLHAGGNTAPQISLIAQPDHIGVVITDKGRGFEPSRVDPGRLGVAGSIAGRMELIPGGTAEVVTGLGSGTSVRLGWTRPSPASRAVSSLGYSPRPRSVYEETEPEARGITDVIGLRSRSARTVAAVFVLCAAVTAVASVLAGMHPLSAAASTAVLAVGVGAVVLPGGDVLARQWTAVCAVTVPLQIIAAAAGLTEPVPDPVGNAAAVSGGVVVCAFLCVRGRVGSAWLGQMIACVVYTGWVIGYGSPVSAVSQVVVPSIGVMIMATVFAALLRPAAREIFVLRAEQTAQAAHIAGVEAAAQERRTQIARLDELARPALRRIREHPNLSDSDKRTMLLLEARLRDGIRARGFDTPAVTDAVWRARDRGATVTLFDDGALDDASTYTVAQLHHTIVEQVDSVDAGAVMTIRIAPPRREYLATVTIITASGRNTRREYDHAANLVIRCDDHP